MLFEHLFLKRLCIVCVVGTVRVHFCVYFACVSVYVTHSIGAEGGHNTCEHLQNAF